MKRNRSSRLLNPETLLSIFFGAAVFVFFGYYYPFHLNYQEQFQLFLFTTDYFVDFANHPGGVADYLGTFFTQFYFYSKIGALVLAALLLILQRLVQALAVKLGAQVQLMPLSFIPSLLYWGLLCNENYLLGGLIAMIFLALFCYLYLLLKPGQMQITLGSLMLIVLYWIAGGVFVFFTLYILMVRFFKKGSPGKTDVSKALVFMVLTFVLPYTAKIVVEQYPLLKFWVGVNYFRYPVNVPIAIAVIGAAILLIPILAGFVSRKLNFNKTMIWWVTQALLLAVLGSAFIQKSADFEKEEVMAYDFHVRMRKWDRAIALANKKQPASPLSVTCLNLALAKQDLLGERMFSYYQNGIGGLIPDFTRDFTIPLMTGEVYYHLGLVNTAQRFAFEAMEALPDYQKSARAIKRLAETNIINGEYILAKKYLRLLQNTLYYKAWANHTLKLLENEKAINMHIEYGWLRKARIQKDFLFSEQEKENMIGQLFTHNPDNRMAFEYLLACSLVKKDLQSFIRYFPLYSSINYPVIPKNFQEALIYVWEVSNKDEEKEIPYKISNAIRVRSNNYKKQYGQSRNAQVMAKNFGDTYWYYLHFRN